MSFIVPIRPSIVFVGDPAPGASDPVFSRAGNLGGGLEPHSAAAPFFSRFVHADSRPTRHEWRHSIRFEGGDHALRGCSHCLGPAGFSFHGSSEVSDD